MGRSAACITLAVLTLVGVVMIATVTASSPTSAALAAAKGRESARDTPTTCNGTLAAGTVVGMAATYDDGGYWIANSQGTVLACGNARAFGGLTTIPNRPVVGIAATFDGGGYYLVASDGGVFTFGDATFRGSTGSIRLSSPVVGIAVDPATGGYWLVAADGGIFAYNAPFYGSTGSLKLDQPVVGVAQSNGGSGYWLVASDGGIFAYNAPFYGSTGSIRLNEPVVGMAADLATGGYWLVASDGGIFAYSAQFWGSTGSIVLNEPIVEMEANFSGTGYRFVASDGGIFTYGTSGFYGSGVGSVPVAPPAPPPPPPATTPNFILTNSSFTPPIESTTFVQSQPGAPLGTPCALYPLLPTTVTATATVAPIDGQIPDSVVVDLDTYPAQRINLSQTRNGSTTWTAAFPHGGFVWMIHTAFPRGNPGNHAPRRLYVDLVSVPLNGIPKIPSGDVAAAWRRRCSTAAIPTFRPRRRLRTSHSCTRYRAPLSVTRRRVSVADGRLTCDDLAQHTAPQIEQSLNRQELDPFESYLVAEFASQYFCPQDALQAVRDLRQGLGLG